MSYFIPAKSWICNKSIYKSEEFACKIALRGEQREPGTTLYWYTCDVCGYFHLTSRKKGHKPEYFAAFKEAYLKEHSMESILLETLVPST